MEMQNDSVPGSNRGTGGSRSNGSDIDGNAGECWLAWPRMAWPLVWTRVGLGLGRTCLLLLSPTAGVLRAAGRVCATTSASVLFARRVVWPDDQI